MPMTLLASLELLSAPWPAEKQWQPSATTEELGGSKTESAFLQGCQRTIYLLDDGKDPKKRKWVDSLGSEVVYVSGRKRPPGEMNGKSGNLNNTCAQLYPKGSYVPGTELVAVFDADQVRTCCCEASLCAVSCMLACSADGTA